MKKTGVNKYTRRMLVPVVNLARKITLPGFEKIPLYDVGVFFFKGLLNGALDIRASAISFSFFMAIFPGIIFIFTLIPFIPIENFQTVIIEMMEKILPANTFAAIETTIVDIATKPKSGLMSIGFIAALIFSTNGISAMIAAFNASVNEFESRKWLSMRLTALLLMLILVSMTGVAAVLILFGKQILTYLVKVGIIQSQFSQFLFLSGQWLTIFFLAFLSISFLYYFAPSKRSEYRFFSPGSIISTVLMILTLMGFSYYLNHFSSYNYLYGSIGTLLGLMLWLNLNAFILLLGFELNISIRTAHRNKKNQLELSESSRNYEHYYPQKDEHLL